MSRQILVIGGGASGLMAAISAGRNGAEVTILEHMDRVGKKILSTGNGKCNMTNKRMSASCFRSDNQGFPMEVIRRFGAEDTIRFFEGLGILPKDKNGYIYPNSEQAASVLDVLRTEVSHLKIRTVTGCHVEKVIPLMGGKGKKNAPRFEVSCLVSEDQDGKKEKEKFYGDAVILAAGSKAAPVTGSDGSGYELARALGHRIIKPLPALVQLICEGKEYRALTGIRTEAKLTLFIDGKEAASDQGELQLTEYGISGIPTFQISRYASKALDGKRRTEVLINFLPSMTEKEAEKFLMARKQAAGYKTGEEFLTGVLNKKLCGVLLKEAGISYGDRMSGVQQEKIKKLASMICGFRARVTATKPFANAQVCCGGVDTREICVDTMESKLVPGLYFAGELLDVDGICGGYNLQWAWASGFLAGTHASGGKTT